MPTTKRKEVLSRVQCFSPRSLFNTLFTECTVAGRTLSGRTAKHETTWFLELILSIDLRNFEFKAVGAVVESERGVTWTTKSLARPNKKTVLGKHIKAALESTHWNYVHDNSTCSPNAALQYSICGELKDVPWSSGIVPDSGATFSDWGTSACAYLERRPREHAMPRRECKNCIGNLRPTEGT